MTTTPGSTGAPPIDLRAHFGDRYRVRSEANGTTRSAWPEAEQSWLLELLCKYGVVYPQGGDILAATITSRQIGRRVAALPCILTSRGDVERVVFPSADATLPLDGREYDRIVFRPALRCGKIRDFRFKDLRHTFATRLRMQGRADISSIAALLGHTSTRMSERYAHADDAHLHALVGALDGPEISLPSDTKKDTTVESSAGKPR